MADSLFIDRGDMRSKIKSVLKFILKSFFLFVLLFASCSTGQKIGIRKEANRHPATPDLLGPSFYEKHELHTMILTAIRGRYMYGGSGFVVVSPSGHFYGVTNEHVCADAVTSGAALPYMTIRMEDGLKQTVPILKVSRVSDLCLVGLPIDVRSGLPLASSYASGDYVEAFGHPGLGPLTLSPGIIVESRYTTTLDDESPKEKCGLNTGETLTRAGCERTLKSVITTITIAGGSSGSPVVNIHGEVVGVAYAAFEDTGVSSMVPLEQLVKFLVDYEAETNPNTL